MATSTQARTQRPYRVLVVANEPVDEDAVRKVRDRARGRDVTAWVVAPVLSPRLKETLGDVGDGIDRAQERLAESLESLERTGIEARGEVGEVDPKLPVEDALRKLSADHGPVDEVIVASPRGEAP